MIEELGLAAWRSLDARRKAPTFFARPAWAAALAQTYPGMRPAPLKVRLRTGEEVLVPLVRSNGGRLAFKEYIGFPIGGYTCVLNVDGTLAAPEAGSAALAAIAARVDRLDVAPWPLRNIPSLTHATRIGHETAVVDLSRGYDAALAGLAGISRRMAGQAARRGVICEPSSEPDAAGTYYDLLCEAARRWGLRKPHIPRALLEALVEHGGDDVEIWFAKHEGTIIAGGVGFYGSEEFFFWSAAMRHEFGRLRPSNALNVALMRAAAARGMLWYNLGASEGLAGVQRFKRDLGAEDVRYSRYCCERSSFALYRQVRRLLCRSAVA